MLQGRRESYYGIMVMTYLANQNSKSYIRGRGSNQKNAFRFPANYLMHSVNMCIDHELRMQHVESWVPHRWLVRVQACTDTAQRPTDDCPVYIPNVSRRTQAVGLEVSSRTTKITLDLSQKAKRAGRRRTAGRPAPKRRYLFSRDWTVRITPLSTAPSPEDVKYSTSVTSPRTHCLNRDKYSVLIGVH